MMFSRFKCSFDTFSTYDGLLLCKSVWQRFIYHLCCFRCDIYRWFKVQYMVRYVWVICKHYATLKKGLEHRWNVYPKKVLEPNPQRYWGMIVLNFKKERQVRRKGMKSQAQLSGESMLMGIGWLDQSRIPWRIHIDQEHPVLSLKWNIDVLLSS